MLANESTLVLCLSDLLSMGSHSVSEGVSRLPNIIFTTTGTDDNINWVGTGTGHRRFNCKFAPVVLWTFIVRLIFFL